MEDIHARCTAGLADGSMGVSHAKAGEVRFRTPRDPAGTPVVIYGASWCGACQAAATYMTRWNIPYVEKDVEKSAAAHAMLLATFQSAHLEPTSVLPIVDVRGTVMKGFQPCLIEQAWATP